MNLNVVISDDQNKKTDKDEKASENKGKKIGRNEKCPCGSEKKYKHCCGKI